MCLQFIVCIKVNIKVVLYSINIKNIIKLRNVDSEVQM